MVCAEGLLDETEATVMYHALDTSQREFTNERYTTHHWQDEENIPILNVIIPLPDGNFLPVTPQPLMPAEQFSVIEASYEDSEWIHPKPNYLPRLNSEPGTDNWGKANFDIMVQWIAEWTTDLLFIDAIDAKNKDAERKTLGWKESFEWALENLDKIDPDIAPTAHTSDDNAKRQIIEIAFEGMNNIAIVNGEIKLTAEI